MKNVILRTSVALACAFGLAACGGGGSDLFVNVGLYGVTQAGLTLSLNDAAPEAIDYHLISYQFATHIRSDSNFSVKIVSSPDNATCVINNGTGKSSTFDPQSITVICTAIPHKLSATVTGLKVTGLVLNNGATRYPVEPVLDTAGNATDIAYKFGNVGEGLAYGIAVLTQPATQTCTVANGSAIMGKTDTNLNITCI